MANPDLGPDKLATVIGERDIERERETDIDTDRHRDRQT